MNYAAIQSHVTRNIGGRASDPAIPALVQDWINSCYLDLVTTGKFPELERFAPIPCPTLDMTISFATTAHDEDYLLTTIATDFMFPISLRDLTNNMPLRQRDVRWYDRNKSLTEGKPRVYINYGGYILLDPTPDANYTIRMRYRKKVDTVALVNPADVPVIGAQWHEALVLGASYRGFRSLGDPRADTYKNDLKTFIISHSEEGSEEEEDYNAGFTVHM
jgi:hypothetical protein